MDIGEFVNSWRFPVALVLLAPLGLVFLVLVWPLVERYERNRAHRNG